MNGLAAAGAAANISSRDIAGNVFEEIDGAAQEMGDNLGGMPGFCFFIRAGAGNQIGRNDEAQGFRANTRPIGNEEVAETEQSLIFLPHGNIEESISPHDEEDTVAVTVTGVAKIAHGIDGIMKLCAAEVFPRLGKRGDKVRVLAAGKRNHGEAMREGSKVLLEFVRRTASGNEMDFVEIKTAVSSAGDGEMAVVNRVE